MSKFVYFAHSMSDYHTQWERDALKYIQAIFKEYTVLNPSGAHHQVKWQKEGMSYFDRYFLPKMDAIAYTPFPNKTVGSGVAYEIIHAMTSDIPIYQMSREFDYMTLIRHVGDIQHKFLNRIETRSMIRRYKNGAQ